MPTITTKDGVEFTTRTGAKDSPSYSVMAGRCQPTLGYPHDVFSEHGFRVIAA